MTALTSRLRWLCLLAALLCTPAWASRDCDQCEDLPRLYRDLLEQEFLRNKFESWVNQAYYPASIEQMQASARNALNQASAADGFYGPSTGRGAGGGNSGGANAAPELGTNMASGKCELMDLSGARPVVTTADALRKSRKYCKPVADFLIAHEESHITSCQVAVRNKDKTGTVEWFAKDDVAAYQAGIKVLREHIAALARQCNWQGSTQQLKPDKTQVVPTPQQIADLATRTRSRAAALRRATK